MLQGIWIANYQALPANKEPIDLTARGAYYTGRKIFLPTCGHRGTLLGAQSVWVCIVTKIALRFRYSGDGGIGPDQPRRGLTAHAPWTCMYPAAALPPPPPQGEA